MRSRRPVGEAGGNAHGHRSRVRRGGLPLVAAALLGLAWLTIPMGSVPPLYDGVGFPDEPYRYVQPPPGYQRTQAPTGAVGQVPVDLGASTDAWISSGEQGPQVQVQLDSGQLSAPPSATQMTIRADPVAPVSRPLDGTIWGNVYRVTATCPQGPVTTSRTADSAGRAILLRAPTSAQPPPVFEALTSTGWHQLVTQRVGNDIYQARLPVLGDYALVRPAHPATQPGAAGQRGKGGTAARSPQGQPIDRILVISGSAVLALALLIVAIRISRERTRRRDT